MRFDSSAKLSNSKHDTGRYLECLMLHIGSIQGHLADTYYPEDSMGPAWTEDNEVGPSAEDIFNWLDEIKDWLQPALNHFNSWAQIDTSLTSPLNKLTK